MRLCRRVAVLRAGRKVAEFPVGGTSPAAIAEAMVGRPVSLPRRDAQQPGGPVLELRGVDGARPRRAAAWRASSLTVHAHEIVGIAGVSGNGQRALAACSPAWRRRAAGEVRLAGGPWPGGGAGRGDRGRRRPHPGGPAGRGRRRPSCRSTENLVLETCRRPACQRLGFLRRGRLAAACRAR